MRTPHPNWPKGRVENLKRLWADGFSAGEISKLITGVTRNAVIGKVHRLGLRRREKAEPIERKVPFRKMVVKPRKSAWQHHLDSQPVNVEPIVEAPIPLHQRRTVETLEANDCRWPIGDPQEADFHFCGAKKLPGLPYCECHARRAFNPASPSEKATPRRSAITNSFVGLRRSFVTEDA